MFDKRHAHSHIQNRFAVIPTAEKLNANLNFTGKGVTIAFLDSGFYPHPDFAGRIIKFHDISGEEKSLKSIKPKDYHWHGTQTVVSCAGDGCLSDGTYRGLACDAKLVLVKVSKAGRISDESIEQGLEWILKNHKKYRIRIVNLSLGGDLEAKTEESRINQLAEKLVSLGIVVTVAAGNNERSPSVPPASALSVITVGGYSDNNHLNPDNHELYHSNFGLTSDGLIKPEVIAPAMFVAAPMLPETETYKMAESLSMLEAAPDYAFKVLLNEYWENAGLSPAVLTMQIDPARQLLADTLYRRKIIATHYQHVDGTSFAAPIVASVVAQMLEANPQLTPSIIKNILISTASRLTNFSALRQGFGVLNAGLAVTEALKEPHLIDHDSLTAPRVEGQKIIFFFHQDDAETVHLAGDFNHWSLTENPLFKNGNGLWQAEIPCLRGGKYRYKFVVNRERWIEDPSHALKEDGGIGGFNSILIIE